MGRFKRHGCVVNRDNFSFAKDGKRIFVHYELSTPSDGSSPVFKVLDFSVTDESSSFFIGINDDFISMLIKALAISYAAAAFLYLIASVI